MPMKNESDSELDIRGIMSGIDNEGCVWELVPPCASQFAGIWEGRLCEDIFQCCVSSLNKVSCHEMSFIIYYRIRALS